MAYLNPEEIEAISNSVSVLEYFRDLERRGIVRYDRKRGKDEYFLTDNNKFSVTDEKYYDFKAGQGGKIIKAVMEMENKSWPEAIEFLKEFSKAYTVGSDDIAEKKQISKPTTDPPIAEPRNVFTMAIKPNNDKLIAYFEGRGISKDILQTYTQQVHYHNKTSGKNYFGIGLKNQSGGYDIKNLLDKPYDKAKVGRSDMSVIPGSSKEMVVFEGMTDMLSFLQICKDANKPNTRTLVVLNSVTNTGAFIDQFNNYEGKIHLVLDGDKSGNDATEKILNNLPNSVDQRKTYNISETGNNDLNDYLINKIKNSLQVQEKSRTLAEENKSKLTENETVTNQPNRVSSLEPVGGKSLEPNHREPHQSSQPQQEGDNPRRQAMDSHNVGNGLSGTEWSHLGGRTGGSQVGTDRGEQQEVLSGVGGTRENPNASRTGSAGGSPTGSPQTTGEGQEDKGHIRPLQTGGREGTQQDVPQGDGSRSEREGKTTITGLERLTIIDKVAHLSKLAKGNKVSNEQIKDLVNLLTFVDKDNTIKIKEGATITDNIKDIVNHYKSGGITKDGRGVLDEYYTDEKLVNAVRNLIKDNFQGKQDIKVLEPSVGTGNFLHATNDLGVKSHITAFEINETTAKIAKILHPEANINLRSFESEFVTDNGTKKAFTPSYDLVVGNPPYGTHRGMYIGLGEEEKLSRYEDYFVKRSLDVMNEGGTLAMVLPSSWLDRQKSLSNGELLDAYRLPNGIFKATGVGTDIVILRKNSQAQAKDITQFFKEQPNKVLGDTIMKKNRFGREEEYIKGSLDEALTRLEEVKKATPIEVAPPPITIKRQEVKQLSIFDLLQEQEQEQRRNAEKKDIQPIQKEVQPDTEQKQIKEVHEKLNKALDCLEKIKFKSLPVMQEIENYNILLIELEKEPEKFSKENLEDISKKAENIINIHSNKNTNARKTNSKENSEYALQYEPNISKKVLKYQFAKDDTIVNTSLQNNPNLTQEQIKAFSATDYNGQLITDDETILNKYGNRYKDKIIHDFYYAEGNIYEKLDQLERDFSDRFGDENKKAQKKAQYEKQKALLESVLPPKKQLEDIVVSPNHEFVHNFWLGKVEKETYNHYMKRHETITVDYSLADKFKDFVDKLPREALSPSSSWEVSEFVDNQAVTGSDKERNALVRERRKEVANKIFQKFLQEELTPEQKRDFVNEFNRKYNNIHIPDYSQFPLFSKINQNFKGKPLQLTEVQKAGIGRLTTKGVGLLAHEVGFGKTLSGVLSMHEAMERGNAKRPLIVVPNDNILKQWVDTIYEAIPHAKVNVLGNLGKDYDLSHFDNKDGEITLVTYEGFNNIGFNKEITQSLANRFSYINEKDVNGLDSPTQREIEKGIADRNKIEGKMKRGKVYDWEDFGFDHLTFDEVHNANHIVDKVRIEDRRFNSDFRNQNQRPSKLGLNTWVASQYIQDRYDGRNVTLLSATPFTNKPLEYYSVLSLMANDRLEKSGYFNVNNFFETFMEADNDMEIDAKGDVKFKTNVRRFKNNALFQQLLSEFIDIKGEEDNPQLKRPNRINKEYKIEQNKLTEDMYGTLNLLLDESKDGAILTHILNARKIAISPYLYEEYDGEKPSTKEFVENSPKLKTTMDLIRQNKADKPEAGQIIYSELGVSEFPRLKEYLVNEVGYKDDEVGIITGATSKTQRLDIQEKFNAGKIKVVIGSEAIQEGMNLQENTSDMYLLTLPYNFTSLRQIEGRMWRQGNKWENVRVNYMLTNDSIDVFMLQKLQAKQARYMEAIKKGASVVDVSDVNTQEMKTAIITDPYTRAKIEVELLKKRLENEKTKHAADLGFISRKYEGYNKALGEYMYVKKSYEDMQKYAQEENGSYWVDRLPDKKIQVDMAQKNLEMVTEKMKKKGINVEDFKAQQERTQAVIDDLDKRIKEELPILENNLIAQYKAEKAERLNRPQTDFVQERAQENKTFYSLRPDEEKASQKVAEEKNNTAQNVQQENTYRGFKR